MPRINIYFSKELWEELIRYTTAKYGKEKAPSITMEQAVKDYLERHIND